MRTSWTLVARIKDPSDNEGWRRFYELYKGLVIGVARKAGLREDEAEVVLQETMTSVSKKIGEFEADPARGSFHAWLLRLTRWRILDQFDKRMPAVRCEPETTTARTPAVERVADPREANLEALCDAEWNRNVLQQAMKELEAVVGADHYQVFYLLTVGEKSVGQAAKLLGKSRPQVYVIKHRVGKVFKGIVKRVAEELG